MFTIITKYIYTTCIWLIIFLFILIVIPIYIFIWIICFPLQIYNNYNGNFTNKDLDNRIHNLEYSSLMKISLSCKKIITNITISNEYGISRILLHTIFMPSKTLNSPSIILIHGTAGSGMSFSKIINTLANYFNVYAIDLPGFGKSHILDITHAYKSRNTFIYDIIYNFMKIQNIDKAYFCGHSLGGYILSNFAYHYPNKILSIILISPAGIFPTLGKWGMYWAIFFKLGIQNITRHIGLTGLSIANIFISSLDNLYKYYLVSHPLNYGEIFFLRPNITLSFSGAYWNNPLYPNKLDNIKCPIKFIYGSKDSIMPAHQGIMCNKIYGHSISIINNAGHNPMETDSENVAKHIIDFLKNSIDNETEYNDNKTIISRENYNKYLDITKFSSSFYIPNTEKTIQKLYQKILHNKTIK